MFVVRHGKEPFLHQLSPSCKLWRPYSPPTVTDRYGKEPYSAPIVSSAWVKNARQHNRFTSCIASHYQCQRRNNLLVFRGTLLSQLFSDQNAQLGSKRKGLRRLFLMDSSFTVNEVQNYVTCRCRRRYREFFKAV